MAKARGKPGKGDRAISDDEAELWKYATRALEPVKGKPRVRAAQEPPPVVVPRKPAPSSKTEERRADASKPSVPAPKPMGKPAPIADFDRRKARQIASGKIEIAARLDLHGDYQRDAHARLRAFLFNAYAKGHKTVLVITGKGAEKEPGDPLGRAMGERQRGVLRRSVPQWLSDPDLRAIVLSFTEASTRHGGAGALYVQLRKR